MIYSRALRRNAYGAAVALTAACGACDEGRYSPGGSLCRTREEQQYGGDGGRGLGGGGGFTSKNERDDAYTKPVVSIPSIGTRGSLNPEWKNEGVNCKRRYKYSVIGGGTTALSAIESIIHQDPSADILLVSDETTLPKHDKYKTRVLKSDLLSSYNEWRRHVTTRLDESIPKKYPSVTVLLDGNHLVIDPERRALVFFDGQEFFFSKCLVAMSGIPRRFYVLDSDKSSLVAINRVNALTTLSDFELIEGVPDMMPEGGGEAIVVGGGFLGTEVALALANRNVKVSQVYAEEAPLALYLPHYLAKCVQSLLSKSGVDNIAERLVTGVRACNDECDSSLEVSLVGLEKESKTVDYVVLASTHVDPDSVVNLASKSGLEIDPKVGGIVVNAFMEALGGVYAAGSCVSYYDQVLGRRRVDTLDHSINSGIIAGYNMVASVKQSEMNENKVKTRFLSGDDGVVDDNCRAMPSKVLPIPADGHQQHLYAHQPTFRCVLESMGMIMEGIGNIDSRLKTYGVWVDSKHHDHAFLPGKKSSSSGGEGEGEECEPMSCFMRGIVYYVNDGKIEGMLLWNASDLLERARDVIRLQPTIFGVDALKSLVPLAPNDWLYVIETQRCREE